MTVIVTQPDIEDSADPAVEAAVAPPPAPRATAAPTVSLPATTTPVSPVEGEQPVLALHSVSKRFHTRRQDTLALDRVTLEVRPREFICIVGPSGCGKSTLLNIAAGIDRDYEGQALFEGAPIRGAARERAVVFQEPALFPWLNVRANVEFGLKLRDVPKRQRREVVDRQLALVDLSKFERAYIHELSGGMKQRAQLARALAVEPHVLLMDEPFAALDAQTRDDLQLELQSVWARIGTTVLFVTHNVREAVILGDRVVVMSASPGRIKRIIDVPLERPRTPDDHAVADLAAQIRLELQNTAEDLEPRYAI
ncbi:MAG: ABC transporter ATP-binding protein [Dehalococcoidia bacterium]|nr:ABC transporter ATP-binding protein [Dehalococcoidia bacterium]